MFKRNRKKNKVDDAELMNNFMKKLQNNHDETTTHTHDFNKG